MFSPTVGGLSLFALLLGQPPTINAQDPAPPPAPAIKSKHADEPPPTGLAAISIDDLINRLPPAGSEWRWDSKAGVGVEDPASIEMARRIATDGSALTDEQWRAVLLKTKAIRYRERWPKDEQYLLSLTTPRWLGISQIRLSPRTKGLQTASVGQAYSSMCGTMTSIDNRDAREGRPLGLIPDGTREIVLDTLVERGGKSTAGWGNAELPGKPAVLWKGTIALPVTLVESFSEAVPPATGEAIDKGVRDAVGAALRQWGDNSNVPCLVIDPDDTAFPALDGVGLDIKAELLRDGKPIAESWLIATDVDSLSASNSLSKSRNRSFGSANFEVDDIPKDLASWSIRLTGSSEHVSTLWNARKRWSGSITIPWTQAAAHERERTAPDGRGPEVSTPHWK